jgi:hypothetical protein
MNNFKKSFNENSFNEDKVLSMLYKRAEKDGLRSQWAIAPKESKMKKTIIWAVGLVTVLVLGLVLTNQFPLMNDNVVMASISVDINPSFELDVNKNGIVLSVEALNDDAQSLDTTDLIGLDSAEAIERIVQLATEAGFIDPLDLEDDYVIVTTVMANDGNDDVLDTLNLQLQERIQNSGILQGVNVIEIKAEIAQKMEAEGKDVPVGLFVLHGMVTSPDGTILSAKEFFSKQGNLDALKIQENVRIHAISEQKIRERIEFALNMLEGNGVDSTELRTRLQNASLEDMLRIQSEVQKKLNAPDDSGNENANQGEDKGSTDSGNQGSTDQSNTDAGGQGNTDSGNQGGSDSGNQGGSDGSGSKQGKGS